MSDEDPTFNEAMPQSLAQLLMQLDQGGKSPVVASFVIVDDNFYVLVGSPDGRLSMNVGKARTLLLTDAAAEVIAVFDLDFETEDELTRQMIEHARETIERLEEGENPSVQA